MLQLSAKLFMHKFPVVAQSISHIPHSFIQALKAYK